MVQCEGFPQVGCPDSAAATCDLLGYDLCDKCADNWRHMPTREDEHAGATINALRTDLDQAHQHIGALVAAIDELDSIYTELTDLMIAARAWLKRDAR